MSNTPIAGNNLESVERVLIIASVKKTDDLNWIRELVNKYRSAWLVTDQKSAELLARENIFSRLEPDRIIVFSGRRPEELSLKIYKISTPDIVYICDKYNVLKPLVELFRIAPVKRVEC